MAKFFLGQRVRITGDVCPSVFGVETRIVGEVWDGVYGDSWELAIRHPTIPRGWTAEKSNAHNLLTPITDPGAAPGIKGTCEPLDKLLSEVRHASVE